MHDNEIKVEDKRLFDAEGELREEGETEGVAREDLPRDESVPKDAPGGEPPLESSKDSPGRGSLPPRIDFSTFVVSLYTSAAAQMGVVTLPGQTIETDLVAAKQTIDILDLIKEKTTGNLDANEAKLLEDLLAQLQLTFVQKWPKD